MKTVLMFLAALLITFIQSSLGTHAISTKVTDCSDGKYINIGASVTPNPAIWVSSYSTQGPTLWLALSISITDYMKTLMSNTSHHEFDKNLKIRFTLEGSSWEPFKYLESILGLNNSERACGGKIVPHYICRKIYESIVSSLNAFPLFFPVDFGLSKTATVHDILNAILEIGGQFHAAIFGQEVLCFRFEFESAQNYTINKTETINRRINAEHSCDTPKVEYVFNGTKSLSCPENSKEISNASCECNYPLSGPLCSFQCRFHEMRIRECLPDEPTNFPCLLRGPDYVYNCVRRMGVPILNGSIIVEVKSLHNVIIKWRLINFIAVVRYELTLYEGTESLGKVVQDDFNFEGLETTYNLRYFCLNEGIFGIDCRDNLFNDDCFDCPDLSLSPFHDYSIDLKIEAISKESSIADFVMKTVNFTTPETDATAPKITSAALSDDEKVIHVEWMIINKCPGYIRHYEIIVSCDSDKALSSGNLFHDCRNNSQGPMLNGTVPESCNKEDIIVKLRIGTTSKLSDESETFLVKNYSLPVAVVVAIALATVLLIISVGSVIFMYYYKKRVQPVLGWYTVIKDITCRRNRDFRQSLRQSNPPHIPKPDTPFNQEIPSKLETPFNSVLATPGETETPSQHEDRNEAVLSNQHDTNSYTEPNFDN